MHFFADHTALPNQNASDKYGPDGGTSTDLYNVSARFELPNGTTVKAFACQSGSLFIRQSSVHSDLVNVIIKPHNPTTPNTSFLRVKYYIYRGILKSSLLNSGGTEITPEATSNNEFIARFWDERASFSNPEDPDATLIGYDNYLTSPIPGNTQVDDVFGNHLTTSQYIGSRHVNEGEWFGDFGGTNSGVHKIDFEVLIDEGEEVTTTLDYVGTGHHNSATDKYQINLSLQNDLTKRRMREQILSFIDPAAFFGLFYTSGVNFSEYSGGNKSTNLTNTIEQDPQNSNQPHADYIYTKFLSKFETKYTIYLDVRSEKGYSYNFYHNYDDQQGSHHNIQINDDLSGHTSQQYGTHGWPIVIIANKTQTPTGSNTDKNQLKFKLRLDGVEKPLILLENTGIRNANNTSATDNHSLWIASRNTPLPLLPDPRPTATADLYTNEVIFHVPNKGAAASKNYVSYYIQLYYFKQEHDENPVSTVMPSSRYFNNAFLEIDRLILGSYNSPWSIGSSQNPIRCSQSIESPKLQLVRQVAPLDNGTGYFEFFAKSGAYWDMEGKANTPTNHPGRVLLHSSVFKLSNAYHSDKVFLPTYSKKFDLNDNYEYQNSVLRSNLDIICREHTINTETVKLLGINNYVATGPNEVTNKYKENLMLLGLTHDELIAIYEFSTGLAYASFHRFIYLDPDTNNPLADDNNMRYYKYTVKIQGIGTSTNAAGVNEIALVTPQLNSQDIIVYSRDNQFFHSKDFSDQEEPTTRENQIEMHIYHDGVIKINDNIDLSLVRKRVLSTRDTLADDNTVTNDQSAVQQIHYYYHEDNTANEAPTHIASFDIVMANKMAKYGRNNNSNTVPNDYTFSINYQTPTTDFGVSAGSSYKHDTLGHIYTTARSGSNTAGLYHNKSKTIFLARVDDATIDDSDLINNGQFSFDDTFRFFGDISLTGMIIGAMVNETNNIISEGLAYGDGSCYPSQNHVNGFAFDTNYLNNNQNDANFINRLASFGFRTFLIGYSKTTLETTTNNTLNGNQLLTDTDRTITVRRDGHPGYVTDSNGNYVLDANGNKIVKNSLHDSHLHSERFEVFTGEKDWPIEPAE